MTFRLFNSLSKKIEDFKPIEEGSVRMYCCGPTVYNYVHIGNLRAFAFQDLVRRYLKFKGFKLKHVMNITDVDDKTIRGSKAAGKPLREYTEFYTKAFLDDCAAIGIEPPDVMPKATEEIPGMVEITKMLMDKGHAYKTPKGDIYFKIATFAEYGKIANLSQQQLKPNADGRLARSDEYDKENANDFALWKAHDDEDGDVFWDTEIGKGRPGWHIECSAMSRRHLGQPFDIHCGGIDLLFPHHTNEIAQSECACGEFVNYWLHNEHLIVNGKKMSKSLGNFFTLRDLLGKGHDATAIRLELLKTHYRQQLDFREDNFPQNLQTLRKFGEFMQKLEAAGTGKGSGKGETLAAELISKFTAAMDDDLNISLAISAVHEGVGAVTKIIAELDQAEAKKLQDAFHKIDGVLGILSWREKTVELEPELMQMIKDREAARKAKDFKHSDELRAALLAKGIEIEDSAGGTKWKRR